MSNETEALRSICEATSVVSVLEFSLSLRSS